MSSNVPTADDDIHVSVDLVPWGLLRRRKNIRVHAYQRHRGIGRSRLRYWRV
jgi:hypothetical protein